MSDRQSMEVDIACVGFGPATGGFLTTLSRQLIDENGQPRFESKVMPGMPLQILCYERADDIGFGVSGVVTRARSIRRSFPDLNPADIPMSAPVRREKVAYLLDPIGASRRTTGTRAADLMARLAKPLFGAAGWAVELPYIPPFLQKHDGLLLSIGQFNQWVGSNLMASGLVQIWPGMPVSEALIEEGRVVGIRLADQGVDKSGGAESGYCPGMDVRAALTVVGDGPVGAIGQQLNHHLGMPAGHHQREWAVGMKMVVELPEDSSLEPGTVFHTMGFPEPEIFGFMYVYPDRLCSLGIFVPSWFDSPVRTSYRYMQHWMQHPYLWRYLKGAELRSWGAKSLQESGLMGEPYLVGDGFARIGEGSGSTNMLTGSGVDEAWETGVLLAEGVIELLQEGKPYTGENLERAYLERRRQSWIQREAQVAARARDGFQRGFLTGMVGMALSGLTGGRVNVPGDSRPSFKRIPSLEEYFAGRITAEELSKLSKECQAAGSSLHDAIMNRLGWPKVEYDGKLLISHQDALLVGGKVQAAVGFADHVAFIYPKLCEECGTKVCIELCSAQAISPGEGGGVPAFDREKCVHCGACLWNCARSLEGDQERGNVLFTAGSGGLHSAEN